MFSLLLALHFEGVLEILVDHVVEELAEVLALKLVLKVAFLADLCDVVVGVEALVVEDLLGEVLTLLICDVELVFDHRSVEALVEAVAQSFEAQIDQLDEVVRINT